MRKATTGQLFIWSQNVYKKKKTTEFPVLLNLNILMIFLAADNTLF